MKKRTKIIYNDPSNFKNCSVLNHRASQDAKCSHPTHPYTEFRHRLRICSKEMLAHKFLHKIVVKSFKIKILPCEIKSHNFAVEIQLLLLQKKSTNLSSK